MARSLMLIFIILPLSACLNSSKDKQLEIELRRSFKNFVASVDERHTEGLNISVFFPDVGDYTDHVKKLLTNYLGQLSKNEPLTFDEQGVVLSRFLGMSHHNYQVVSIEPIDDRDMSFRISIRFNYDANIKQAQYETGTLVYIPAMPWGTVHRIVIDGDTPAPRNQLAYTEIVVVMRRTNYEGFWQVRSCKVDDDSMKFETSYETF